MNVAARLFVGFGCLATLAAQGLVFEDADVARCKTPDGSAGRCVHLMLCPPLLDLLGCPLPDAGRWIRQSSCQTPAAAASVFLGRVCCPTAPASVRTCFPDEPPQPAVGFQYPPLAGFDFLFGPVYNPQRPLANPALPPPTPIIPAAPKPAASVLPESCGISSSGGRVVGGSASAPGSWPWMAILIYNGRTSAKPYMGCAATLITDRHVVTAAHCLERHKPSFVRLGRSVYKAEDNSEDVAVARVAVHPMYRSVFTGHDVAVVTLARRVVFTAAVQPICLSADPSDLSGATAVVAGWGTTKESGSMSEVLREARLPIIEADRCRRSYQNIADAKIDGSVLCAGHPSGGVDSCQGDSGGPLMMQSGPENRFHQVGVVSWGIGCARAGYPGVYTRVSHFLDWIKAQIS